MDVHRHRVTCVMVGVGAAFQFHAGEVAQAPSWIRRNGLEWAFRLCMEPKRLWRRYARHNPRFVLLLARQKLLRVLAGQASERLVSRPPQASKAD
jgi:N-acetylglucosaminyldiphosphoundecaprenol N-acetyl-beta-D-mannosaminyltransferase